MIRNDNLRLIFGALLLIVVFSAFQSKNENEGIKTIEELIQLKVSEKVSTFKNRSIERCQERVIKRANEIVDSILIAQAKRVSIIDSIQKPPKPIKPEKPIIPIVEDTTPIKPLLPEN